MRKLLLVILLAAVESRAQTASRFPPEIVALTTTAPDIQPSWTESSIPQDLVAQIHAHTWHAGCPVPVEDLRLLHLSYWDFTGRPQNGVLIVHQEVAADVLFFFTKLFEHGFLIERMEPVEHYNGSDDDSMAANNTSSFNCRDVAGKPGRFSNHSWGRAIDINPLTNPMLLHGKSLPPEGARFVDRSKASPGSILDRSFIVQLFRSRGWTWGGEWNSPDYQHFEKPDPHRQ